MKARFKVILQLMQAKSVHNSIASYLIIKKSFKQIRSSAYLTRSNTEFYVLSISGVKSSSLHLKNEVRLETTSKNDLEVNVITFTHAFFETKQFLIKCIMTKLSRRFHTLYTPCICDCRRICALYKKGQKGKNRI